MVVEVREDFKKYFNRKLENCAAQVRCKPKERCRSVNTHLRWFEPAGSCWLLRVSGESSPSTSVLATSLSQTVCEGLGGGSSNDEVLARAKIGWTFWSKVV